MSNILLASTSPRRSSLLEACGVVFTVVAPNCNEDVIPNETPDKMVERLSLLKATSLRLEYPNSYIIGADTTVYIKDRILGKPSDTNEAFIMLKSLQGATHFVWSAFTIVNHNKNIVYTESAKTTVQFNSLEDSEIERYITNNHVLDKAGAYSAQDYSSYFISNIEGSFSNLIGLDTCRLMSALKRLEAINLNFSLKINQK